MNVARGCSLVAFGCIFASLGGCLERKLMIMSDPPGATVWVNDVEVGRTPVQADFKYYGKYDVRLRKEGFENVATSAAADAPWYEFVGPDLIAEAAPAKIETAVKWTFTLQPALEQTQSKDELQTGLLQRATAVRQGEAKPPAQPK